MSSSAKLYLFPVPLANGPLCNSLPQRNIEVVSEIKFFIVENIRSARRFLKKCNPAINIDELTFSVLNEQTPHTEIPAMLQPLRAGNSMGIISEAGCPAVADPGSDAVAIAQREGFEVVPLVGPSSILLALMGSGFNGQSFAFNGYLPIDKAERAAKLKTLQKRIRNERQTQIFIETPYRNNRLISELCASLPPDMLLCVATDITGETQNIRTQSIGKWAKEKYNYDKTPTIFLLFN